MFNFKILTFLEIKYLLDHELGRRGTLLSSLVTKLAEGVKRFQRLARRNILIWITGCQK